MPKRTETTWSCQQRTRAFLHIGVLSLLVVLCGTGCYELPQENTATEADADRPASSDHVVALPSKDLRLPSADWKAMTNEYEWADNFEQKRKESRHEFPRVVTIYKLPMTDDRRVGVRISPTEYVEMFIAHPGTITVQLRVDKKSYWVLSRETFSAKSVHGVDTTTLYHTLYDEEFKWARQAFQAELDTSRYLLQSSF